MSLDKDGESFVDLLLVKWGIDRLNTIVSLLLNFLKSVRLTDYTQLWKKQQSGSAARPRLSASRSKSDQYGPILADPSDNEVLTIGAEPVRREGGCSRTRLTFSRSVEAIPSDLPLYFSLFLSFVSSFFPLPFTLRRAFCLGSSWGFRLSSGTGHRNDRLTQWARPQQTATPPSKDPGPHFLHLN